MNQNAKKWIKALRSGKYRQGQMALKTADGKFCCLGVACDVYRKEALRKGSDKVWTKPPLADNYQFGKGLAEAFLPKEVMKWLGMKDWRGSVVVGDKVTKLDLLNDEANYSLEQIADVIEKHQDQLFVNEEVKTDIQNVKSEISENNKVISTEVK